MKIFLSRDDKNLLKFIPFFFIILFFISCKKSLNENIDSNNTPPDLVTKITSSVSGYVTDQYDVAIVAADVKVGTSNTTTDRYGYFEIKNVEVVKEAATVTVSFPGFFKGIKTYMATSGKSAFFRIKLIPKTNVGNINAGTGGAVSLTNGLNISLPANAVKIASTGSVYSGTVNVAATWIDPTSPELHKIMPGDLRGINTDGLMKGLTTYGMMAVELTGSSGELLQIADGKKSVITFPIPASISSSAPATIPLWYFNETNGLWKEEGIATKTGNTYMGEVSHFSFWNCDVPNINASFDCTVLTNDGQPYAFALVKISVVGATNDSRYGYTDLSGFVTGLIPGNTSLMIEIIDDANCNVPYYSNTFSSTTGRVTLSNIILPANTASNITGNVATCNGSPVTNGYLILYRGGIPYHYNISNTSSFNVNQLYCQNNNSIELFAIDLANSQQSPTITRQLTAGINSLGTINACGISSAQFMSYTINGINYYIDDNTYNSFSSTVMLTPWGNLNELWVDASTGLVSPPLQFSFQANTISISQPSHRLYSCRSYQFGIQSMPTTPVEHVVTFPNPVLVYITEFGNPGEYISGHFSGIGLDDDPPHAAYNFSCSFRVKRN
jgi:hypothetical protein